MVIARRWCTAARTSITIAKWAVIGRSSTADPTRAKFAVGLWWAIAVLTAVHFSTQTGHNITNVGSTAFGLTVTGLLTWGIAAGVDVRKISISTSAALAGASIPE